MKFSEVERPVHAQNPKQAEPSARTSEPNWVREARAYIGVREIPGKQHNPTILGWAKGLGVKALGIAVNDDETPWCGLFVAHCLKSCGLPTAPIAVRAKAWANYGSALNSPRYGAIAVFGRQGGGHVGLDRKSVV